MVINHNIMEQLITQYIEKQIKINNTDIINETYEFLVNNIIKNIDDTLIFNDELIYKNLIIPDNFEKVNSTYPIEGYHYCLKIGDYNVNINVGIDWFGIRKCGDEYCYYIFVDLL